MNDDRKNLRRPWRSIAGLLLALSVLAPRGAAQDSPDAVPALSRDRFKSGAAALSALTPLATTTRHSIVKLDVNGVTVALATVIGTNGLALTKASEVREGRLTAWIAGGREAPAALVAVDAVNDVALVRVDAPGLKPVAWASEDVAVGQWAVTPGIEPTPHAVGIVSVAPRRIQPKRALIGVELDAAAKVNRLMPGFGAEKAGLKPGDVILAVNGKAAVDREDVVNQLRDFRNGETVKLRVRRAEEEFDASVVMLPPPESEARGFGGQDRINRFGGGLSGRAEDFALAIQHDTVLQPWLCGGPLVNLDGQAVGLNIARAGRVATYALPASLVKEIIADLKNRADTESKSVDAPSATQQTQSTTPQ